MKSLVIGNGIKVVAPANLLLAKGVPVVVFEISAGIYPYEITSNLISTEDVEVYSGSLPVYVLADVGDVILADGMSPDETIVRQLRGRGHRIIGEFELAASYDRGKLLAITGTKGRTSATALLGKIVKDATRNAFVVEDSASYLDAVCSTTKDSTTVAKVSAYHLETMASFRPIVSSIINIKRNYPEDYASYSDYAGVIERIIRNQTPIDHIVLNYEDDETRRFGIEIDDRPDAPIPFFFSTLRELRCGLFIRNNTIVLRDVDMERELMKTSDISMVGRHNLENAFTAIAMAYKYGISIESIVRSCKGFGPVAHRVEYIATKNGVKFFNDSKGTDVPTAINGIEAMDCPTYLIGGGYDNGADYGEWIESFRGKVRKLVLIGQTRERMASCAHNHGFYDYVYAEDLNEAVSICTSYANPGEAVLLSPACEDHGTYKTFEERGNAFRAIVESL